MDPQNVAANLEDNLQGRESNDIPPRNYDRGYHRMNVLDKKRKKLSQLKMAGIWPKVLKHPELAFANDCLIEGSIYNSKYVSSSFNKAVSQPISNGALETSCLESL